MNNLFFGFNIFKNKRIEKLPKAIFFCGMYGSGKTTLVENIFSILKSYNFELIQENKTKKDFDKIVELKMKDNSSLSNKILFRYNLKYNRQIIDNLLDEDKNLIADFIPLNEIFIKIFTNYLNDLIMERVTDNSKLVSVLISSFEKYVEKYNLENFDFSRVKIILLENSFSKENFYNRGLDTESIPEEFFSFYKKELNDLYFIFGNYLKSRGVNFVRVDVSFEDLKNKKFGKKFIEDFIVLK